jgi:hypothetical protein
MMKADRPHSSDGPLRQGIAIQVNARPLKRWPGLALGSSIELGARQCHGDKEQADNDQQANARFHVAPSWRQFVGRQN